MLGHDDHDALVCQLYAAACGALDWSAILKAVGEALGHGAGVLALADPTVGSFRAEAYGRTVEFTNDYYVSETFHNDPRTPYFLKVAPGMLYFDRLLYDAAAMRSDPRVQETVERIGVAYQLGASLRLPHGGAGMFTLLSTDAEGQASDSAVAAFRRLAPHIEQALALGAVMSHSAATQAALIEALSEKADGLLLLNRAGAISFANEAARAVLSRGDGLAWGDDGPVALRSPEMRRLRQLVHDALLATRSPADSRSGGQTLVTRGSGLKPYVVRVMPAPGTQDLLGGMNAACVVHIHDLAACRTPSREVLRTAFGLSKREAELAVALFQHASLGSAATAVGMAHNTARNHLQALFRKCGVTSQTEAMKLLGSLPST